jgi:hypothetical protein
MDLIKRIVRTTCESHEAAKRIVALKNPSEIFTVDEDKNGKMQYR